MPYADFHWYAMPYVHKWPGMPDQRHTCKYSTPRIARAKAKKAKKAKRRG